MTVTFATLTTLYSEFASVAEATVNAQIARALLRVDEAAYGELFDDAVTLVACHLMAKSPTIAAAIATATGINPTLAGAGAVSSFSLNDSGYSVSYSRGRGNGNAESEYLSTVYGQQFLELAILTSMVV
jgi:hypothetical protein